MADAHKLPCPLCGQKALHDDQAGGLFCRACGHNFQMGWDDPESWMEGKFDWDFNLPLEGLAETAEPGEAEWVLPTRDYGPVHHGHTASSRSLYHGTLIDHLPAIQQWGLQPDVGSFVNDAYQEESGMSPEEYGVRPAVFMTDKKRLNKAVSAIIHNVAQKLGKGFHEVTPNDVRNHGLLVKYPGEMGYNDPPMDYVFDEEHEEPFEEQFKAEPPERPYQAEPGDFYSESPVSGFEYIHGPAMMRLFERHGVAPRNSPFAWNVVDNAMRQRQAWNFRTASLNTRKLYTTAEDHERGKRRWGLPWPHHLRRAAADPEWLRRWIEVNGPYMVHQTEDEPTREKIMQEGLIPHDQGPGSQYNETLVPRANHTYLSRNLHALSPSATRTMRYEEPDSKNEHGENATQRRSVAIDLRKLDPSRINADEDAFDPTGGPHWSRVAPSFPLEFPHDVPIPKEQLDEVPEEGLTWHRKRVHDSNGGVYNNGGEWADKNNITQPHHTAWSMNTLGHAAIEGGVSPEALVRPSEAWADLQANYPHAIPEGYGRYHTPISPPKPQAPSMWTMPEPEPSVEAPVQGQMIAHLMDDMRNAFGRFAASAPWELGKWGKGLFFPETGQLVLWSDDRGHSETLEEDEFQANTEAHHLIIRPDGGVRDQGAMDRNYDSTEGDVPGLAQALKEYSPDLKIDKGGAWEFGPTEPMESEPSINRAETGGPDSPTVQTGNDFAGSL